MPVFKEVSRSELVEKYIMDKIVSKLEPDSRIPAERALAKELGVALPTINKILVSLTDRGILYRRKGAGTFVAEKSLKGKVVRIVTQSARRYDASETLNWFHYQFVLDGFIRKARECGIVAETFFFDTYHPVTRPLLNELLAPGADGYLFHMVMQENWDWGKLLMERGKIVVARSAVPSDICHSVSADIWDPMHEAIHFLAQRGRKRFAFVMTPPHADYSRRQLESFQHALQQENLPFYPELLAEARFTPEVGYRMTMDMLNKGLKFDAIFSGLDTRTFGILKALKDAGLNVPRDVAVWSADDLPECVEQEPPLSVIPYPVYEIGEKICDIFVETFRKKITTLIHHEVPRKFILRESCMIDQA